jgi:hypothetical protein
MLCILFVSICVLYTVPSCTFWDRFENSSAAIFLDLIICSESQINGDSKDFWINNSTCSNSVARDGYKAMQSLVWFSIKDANQL